MSLREQTIPLLRLAAALAVSVAALAAGGCSSSLVDSVPSWAGGEPTGTPERPAIPTEYPPVNDRPPARNTKLITEEEQAKLERQLATVRDSQAAQAKEVKKDHNEGLANTPQSASAKPKATQEKTKQKNPPPD